MSKKHYSPLDIAKWFINRVDRSAGDSITHLKLQKLLYYTEAWWLANKGAPLFKEDMQAWTHGPVLPSVWHEYKDFGWQSLDPIDGFDFKHKELEGYLNLVYEKYGKYNAKQLEELTHREDPWKKTRGILPVEAKCTVPIDKELIRTFYAARLSK